MIRSIQMAKVHSSLSFFQPGDVKLKIWLEVSDVYPPHLSLFFLHLVSTCIPFQPSRESREGRSTRVPGRPARYGRLDSSWPKDCLASFCMGPLWGAVGFRRRRVSPPVSQREKGYNSKGPSPPPVPEFTKPATAIKVSSPNPKLLLVYPPP